MFRVNLTFIIRVIVRTLASILLCSIVLLITGRIADSQIYIGTFISSAAGERTLLASEIFKLLPSYGNLILSILLLIVISSTLIFIFIKNYINKRNRLDWYLLIYLPCLLIYGNTPSKEYLFFFPAFAYILLESEHLINNQFKKNSFLIYITKTLLLVFMYVIRGPLSINYIILAILIFIFKTFNLKFSKIRNLNFSKLIILSFIISIAIITIMDPSFIIDKINGMSANFTNKATTLTRIYDLDLLSNLYNPFNFLKIQFYSFFPTISEFTKKPYTLLIVYESLVFLYLFFKSWSTLFLALNKDERGKFIFSIFFIFITCSYFLLYGPLGYFNIGSSQRFRTNFVPISLVFPLVTKDIIYKKSSNIKSIHK